MPLLHSSSVTNIINYFPLQVFDIVLNGDHTIVTDLDIYDRVGRGVAHDEYISFSVNHGRLYYNEEESDIRGGKIRVEFIKVSTSWSVRYFSYTLKA